MNIRKKPSKVCDLCGKNYFRRNLIEGWTKQNPGKRAGWWKEKLRVCLLCMPQSAATRMILRVTSVVVR
jgi:hypothetical protein